MSDTTGRDPEQGSDSQEPVDADVAAQHAGEGDVVVPREDGDEGAAEQRLEQPTQEPVEQPAEESREQSHETTDEHPVTAVYAEPAAEDGTWASEPSVEDVERERVADDERTTAVVDQDDIPDDATADEAPQAYVPVRAGTHASADTGEPVVPATGAATTVVTPTPIYVTAPERPKRKSNRGVGLLIALLGAVVFAVVYALVVAAIGALGGANERFMEQYVGNFLARPVFWVPVVFFAIAMVILVLILNRSRWWAYIIGGFFVAVIVYLSFIGGALLGESAWQYTPEEALRFVNQLWVHPFALAAGIVAREVTIWFGAWLAARGRRLTARNAEAQAEYERRLAEGPHATATTA